MRTSTGLPRRDEPAHHRQESALDEGAQEAARAAALSTSLTSRFGRILIADDALVNIKILQYALANVLPGLDAAHQQAPARRPGRLGAPRHVGRRRQPRDAR